MPASRRSARTKRLTLKNAVNYAPAAADYGLDSDEDIAIAAAASSSRPGAKRRRRVSSSDEFEAAPEENLVEEVSSDGSEAAESQDEGALENEVDHMPIDDSPVQARSAPPNQKRTVIAQSPQKPTEKSTEKSPREPTVKATWTALRKVKTQTAYRATLLPRTPRNGFPESDGELWRYQADNFNKSLRTYAGPLQRHDRFALLLFNVYGPDMEAVRIADRLRYHFHNFVLPARGLGNPDCVIPSPWLPDGFDKEQRGRFRTWYERVVRDETFRQKQTTLAPEARKKFLPHAQNGNLITFLGLHNSQRVEVIPQGTGIPITEKWEQVNEDPDGPHSNGWLFDAGGIPIAMGWAPRVDPDADQILALAVAPHSDYAFYRSEDDLPKDDKTTGSIQFWRFGSELDAKKIRRPTRKPPQRVAAICFKWGRPTRIQWCPVAPAVTPGSVCGILGVVCGGQVQIIEVREPETTDSLNTVEVQKPITTLTLLDQEAGVTATCFTWIDINRIAVAFKDGTIAIWSLQPFIVLQRHIAHHINILDICSGYPSRPYMVASLPMGGCPTITDFTDPCLETSSHPTASANFQPNMLDWNDHMQGFISSYASSTPDSTTAAFLPARFPAQLRTVFQGFSQPTCVAAGQTHPYTLIGCADGSLWAFNMMHKVFHVRDQLLYKIKLFQHEFRRANEQGAGGPKIRGVVRFLHGFKPEVNDNPRNDFSRFMAKTARDKRKYKSKIPGKKVTAVAQLKENKVCGANDGLVDRTEKDDYPDDHIPQKGLILHEVETRVVKVAWNPNIDVGWWAAAAMGSGLVRVMDLGLE